MIFQRRPLRICSHLTPAQALTALEQAFSSGALTPDGFIQGRISGSHVQLAHHRRGTRNSLKRHFRGQVQASGNGSLLSGHFGLSWRTRIWLAAAATILLAGLYLSLLAPLLQGKTPDPDGLIVLALVAYLGTMLRVGSTLGRHDRELIGKRIQRALAIDPMSPDNPAP